MDSDFCKENKNQNEPFLDLMLNSVNEEIKKAPDCVCQTIIKRMEQLNEEISDCEELLSRLKAEYTAHANFIMNGPFEHKNLSQSSENMIKSPQPFG